MPSTPSSVATWRRMLLLAITALTALLAVSFTAPQDAHAFMNPSVVTSQHVGWVNVKSGPRICTTDYPSSYCGTSPATAWRWSGRSWSQVSISAGTQVYAYPYTGAWHWIWTQRTGWLAIQTANLERQVTCGRGYAYACPIY
jgi:hypothetical protein